MTAGAQFAGKASMRGKAIAPETAAYRPTNVRGGGAGYSSRGNNGSIVTSSPLARTQSSKK
jgi:hypothetical protein